MEKTINLSTESEYYQNLTNIYIQLSCYSDDHMFTTCSGSIDCHEILKFCVDQAEFGENVYLIGFPRQIKVLHRPNTLFFMEKWYEMQDVTNVEHALCISINNRNLCDHTSLMTTYSHILKNFKSVISISLYN